MKKEVKRMKEIGKFKGIRNGIKSCRDKIKRTCNGNFSRPVGRAFEDSPFSLIYGVYVSVRIHIKRHSGFTST